MSPVSTPPSSFMLSAERGTPSQDLRAGRRRTGARGRRAQVGVLGLLIAVTLAAALLAFSLYQGGSLIARLISDYAS